MNLAERLARLSPRQRELLGSRLRAIESGQDPARSTGGRLVAFVTADPGVAIDTDELRRSLGRSLPDYMIPTNVVVVDALPRNMNGKVDRKRLHASVPRPEPSAPDRELTDVEASLLAIWREVLGREDIGTRDNFFEIGGDSILSIQIIARAKRAGLRLTPTQMFEHPTIAELARRAPPDVPDAEIPGTRAPDSAPLTPIQEFWFQLDTRNPDHWNMAFQVEVAPSVSRSVLRRVLERVHGHHDALRFRFETTPAGRVQRAAPIDSALCFDEHDISDRPAEEQEDRVREIVEQMQVGLDLRTGPVVRFGLFELGADRPRRLVMVAHHLVMDAVSWRVILDDLESGCQQAAEGHPVRLATVPTSYLTWAEDLKRAATAGQAADERDYWTAVARPAARLPVDLDGGDNTELSAGRVSMVLDEGETTALLRQAPSRHQASVEELLCAALQTTLTGWAGDSVTIHLEGHGREDILEGVDLSRTVGWFSSIFPVLLKATSQSPEDRVAAMRTQLRAIPRRGIGYGILRYLADRSLDCNGAEPEVCFNYLGRFDSAIPSSRRFHHATMGPGRWRDPEGRRTHLLTINAWIAEGLFRIDWGYSESRHRRETVEALAQSFIRALRTLVGDDRAPHEVNPQTADRPRSSDGEMEEAFTLSAIQEGILFHELYSSAASIYWNQFFFTIEGPFETETWERAWQEVVDRHPALRTCFSWRDGERPLQIVRPHALLDVAREDWRGVPDPAQEERFATLLSQDAERGTDLGEAPLMRITTVRLGAATHRCLWCQHHLLLDGWSGALVLDEVFRRYEALRDGRSLPLPRSRPYRDYVAWLDRQSRSDEEKFWRQRLKGFSAPTPLKPGWVTGAGFVDRANQGQIELGLPRSLADALGRFAREERVTLNTLFQGAWAILLGAYSGESDVVFGATVSVRPPDIEGIDTMVGLFINTVPVRVPIPGGTPLSSWLRQLQRAQAELLEHSHGSLADIQSWSDIPRPLPLFESLLVFENYAVGSLVSAPATGLKIGEFGGRELTNYPLALQVRPVPDLHVAATYDRRRFDERELRRILRRLQTLLEGIVDGPERRLAGLPRLTEDERRQLLVDWNDTTADYPAETPVHGLFEEQVERAPEAIAVECDGDRVTYRELDGRANQLARRLRSQGVGPDVLVGICVERSLEMVVGVLGILKAGGAYVPLDPEYPAERLAFMLEDAGSPVLLTQSHLEGVFARDAADEVICLDRDWPSISRESPENPRSDADAEHLAYVIYTSGSTGRPKGVQIPHRALSNFLCSMRREPGLESGDVLLAITTLSFDIAALELYLPLIVGARVVVARHEVAADAAALSKKLSACAATAMQATPTTWRMLLESGWKAPPDLKMLCGGEELPLHLARQLLETGGDLWNLYGPTETTIWSTATRIQQPLDDRVTIGRPIANTRVYILDAHLQPVPPGAPGELYIGGAGLARGYLKRPDLTSERFIANPLAEEPGARLYRTGDLARYGPDGDIEFLGRVDDQVKVRGFRIELGEIESRLASHEAVGRAVVVAREDRPGDQRLVAYVATSGSRGVESDELRSFLRQSLPGYMVPSMIMAVETFPLTPNGKVDRRALPVPGEEAVSPRISYEAPGSLLEVKLTELFKEVLGRPEIGVTDDFFEVGGHSLLATRLFARMEKELGLSLPLATLFHAPTIRELAKLCDEKEPTPARKPLQPRARGASIPLSFAQQRLWFLDRLEPGRTVYNIPSGLRLKGTLDEKALRKSLDEIIRCHEVLRTRFTLEDGAPVQVVEPSFELELPLVRVQAVSPDSRQRELATVLAREARRSFVLNRLPLVRASLVRVDEAEHVLFFMAHHAVFDGWSAQVFLRELAVLYEAFSAGKPSPREALPIQYADFSIWQRECLEEELEEQLDYWREVLQGELPVLELPTDHPRPAAQSYRGADEPLELSVDLTGALAALGRSEGATLFMVLLAAFKALLHRQTGQEDVIVGTPIANRRPVETEGLIGFFANTLALRTRLDGSPSFRELLRRVRDGCIGAYSHQDVPFERLVEALNPARDVSRTPVFQAFFAFEPDADHLEKIGELSVERVPVSSGDSRTDLSLWTEETIAGGMRGSLEYSTDLFEAATIRRLLARFQILLAGIVETPDAPIGSLEFLTEAEHRELVHEWNRTSESYPSAVAVHDLVEAAAARGPDAPAVIVPSAGQGGETALTYRQLDERSSALADRLRRARLKPGSLVGLHVERSSDMLIGLLGVLKAGAAYVPLDPSFPPERIRFMVEDSGLSVVLTQKGQRGSFPADEVEIVTLDAEWNDVACHDADRPPPKVDPEQLAYVIYTSGSTGRPKGVEIPHRAVVNFLTSMARRPGLSQGDMLLAVTTLSFDIAVLELLLPLVVGATVVVASREDASDGRRLAGLLDRYPITAMQGTPATWRLLLEAGWQGSRTLKALCGGEALRRDLAAELVSRSGSLWNMYGPTETTIWSTTRKIESAAEINLGRPIMNTQTYVLNPHLQPVPAGTPGELYIGGAGLARGYLGQPTLTRERFVASPFTEEPGERLYRTGDLVKYGPDGDIEFLGRVDDQVKVRGFRIELGEIESRLASHDAVGQAVVVAREDRPGDQRLVAYVAASGSGEVPVEELRDLLRQSLPGYMVPSVIVPVEAFPLTPNGKVDRRALPAPGAAAASSRPSHEAPRSHLEVKLTELWKEVLGQPEIGVTDDFFEIGGHSLLAARLFARMETDLGLNLPLATLFQTPTIRALAEQCGQRGQDGGAGAWRSLVPIQPEGSRPPLFCVHPAGGNVLIYRDLARRLGPDQPVYGLQARGLNGREPFLSRFEDMAAHYIDEIRRVRPSGPYHLGGYCLGGTIAYEMARQLTARGEEVGALALFESYNVRTLTGPASVSIRFRRSLENVAFHVASVAQLESRGKARFVFEKGKVAGRRFFRMFLSAFAGRPGRWSWGEEKGFLHARLTKVNDEAQRRYEPKPYAGRVTLFKPKRELFGEDDPRYGWGEIATGGVEVHTLPVYPRAMLVEPFAKILAEALGGCLDATIASPASRRDEG